MDSQDLAQDSILSVDSEGADDSNMLERFIETNANMQLEANPEESENNTQPYGLNTQYQQPWYSHSQQQINCMGYGQRQYPSAAESMIPPHLMLPSQAIPQGFDVTAPLTPQHWELNQLPAPLLEQQTYAYSEVPRYQELVPYQHSIPYQQPLSLANSIPFEPKTFIEQPMFIEQHMPLQNSTPFEQQISYQPSYPSQHLAFSQQQIHVQQPIPLSSSPTVGPQLGPAWIPKGKKLSGHVTKASKFHPPDSTLKAAKERPYLQAPYPPKRIGANCARMEGQVTIYQTPIQTASKVTCNPPSTRQPSTPSTWHTAAPPLRDTFFCCDKLTEGGNSGVAGDSTSKFAILAVTEFKSWTQTAESTSPRVHSALHHTRRLPAFAPYVIELAELNGTKPHQYYMPVPRLRQCSASTNITALHNVNDQRQLSYICINTFQLKNEFLGEFSTMTWFLRCHNPDCPTVPLAGGAHYRLRLIPAQYSFMEEAIEDSTKRIKVKLMRKALGNAIYTQDLLLGLDVCGGDVDDAVKWVRNRN